MISARDLGSIAVLAGGKGGGWFANAFFIFGAMRLVSGDGAANVSGRLTVQKKRYLLLCLFAPSPPISCWYS
jgi:hypothetical protein